MQCLLQTCQQALLANGFDVYRADTAAQAGEVFFRNILPSIKVSTLSWGDSMTLHVTGILEQIQKEGRFTLIRTFEKGIPWAETIERRRQALLVDLFMTGSNALTADGKLVNLDMIGNRTAAIAFGPKKVVIFAGRNKVVNNLDAAVERVRQVAAPRNTARHEFATPCVKTGRCHDCSSPQRICNTWTIMEKCYPKGRIKVVLIDEDLGL